MSWSLRHQLIIFLIVTTFFALTGFILWFIYHERPSCFDGIKNQNELDVDCGGVCAQVCLREVTNPIIWWQQNFKLKNSTYSAAALIENNLDNFGIAKLDYVFKIYGFGQLLLKTVSGSTFVNPNEKTLIYQPNIFIAGQVPERVVIEFATTTLWQRVNNYVPPQISLSEGRFINSQLPEVRAVIRNDSLETYRNIEVSAILSDVNRNVLAASKTEVEVLAPGSSRDVFFSWPEPFDVSDYFDPIIDLSARFNTLVPKEF